MASHYLLTLLVTLLIAAWPAEAAPPGRGAAAAATASVSGPVNINTAEVKELMTLAGVGKTVAQKIVEYRQKNGPFASPEDLRRVSGIGKGLWERNRQRIVVK
jgi:competence protein ComEA